ncbi:MAG: single-stranded DNA-binding protein [Spirochaetales bacterium]|jgi:single-strand DNA-binding protein|nr:single-stranded DNA-binding protein [Spirochaetales bacterium]
MNHLNSILLEGVVTNDPKVVLTSALGNSLVKFSVANDRFYYDKDHNLQSTTLFIGIQAWGRLGEQTQSFIEKGMLVRVVGRLRPIKFKRKDESLVDTFEIVAQHIEYKKRRAKKEEVEEKEDDNELVTLDGDLEECVEEPLILYDYEG